MTTKVQEELENIEDSLLVDISGAPEEGTKDTDKQGKTREELMTMNEEAQKQISKQGNEIGELRRLTDEILRKQLDDEAPEKTKPEADWDYHPKEAAEELVQSKVQAIEEKLEESNRQRALADFTSKHPNFVEIAGAEDFRGWVSESPFRTRMYEQGNAGDLVAADSLLTEWARLDVSDDSTEDSTDDVKKKALKAAKMEKGGGTPSSKKVYRRRDIINLRLNDPKAFETRRAEISLAYKEGRVRQNSSFINL